MVLTAASASSGGQTPRFNAVVITPMPSGLVMINRSPGRAPALVMTPSRGTKPVTANPYFGSGSSIECPPTIVVPLDAMTSAPPWRTSPRSSKGSPVRGQLTNCRAVIGRPAHGVDIGEGVGGGDPTPVVGVVDDRCEVIDRLHQRFPGGQLPHSGIVGGLQADEEMRRRGRRVIP